MQIEKEASPRKGNPGNLKFKHHKTGGLRISCKGSGMVAWIGNKFHPVKCSEIPKELDDFCKRCELECERKKP